MNMNLPFTHLIPRVFNPQHATMLKFTQWLRHTRRFEHAWNLNLKSTPGVQGRTWTRKASFSGETYFDRKPDCHRPITKASRWELMQDMVQGHPAKNKKQRNALSHTAETPDPLTLLPGPVPGRKQRKTLCWWWLPTTYPLLAANILILPPTPGPLILGPAPGENIVRVVALPRTYSLPVPNTLSRTFHLAARSRTWEKAKKTLCSCLPSKNLFSASDKHSLTLLPTPVAGRKPTTSI